jgi:hypothetical protein
LSRHGRLRLFLPENPPIFSSDGGLDCGPIGHSLRNRVSQYLGPNFWAVRRFLLDIGLGVAIIAL